MAPPLGSLIILARTTGYAHLYFAKQFGCLIAEHGIPLDISEFSHAILQGTAHPKLFLAFWSGFKDQSKRHVARSHVQTASLNGHIAYAGWFYIVDPIAVNVIYSEPSEHRKGLVHAWHPSNVGKLVRIVGL